MKEKKITILIAFIAVVSGLATFLLALEISQAGKIYPRVKLASIDLGGRTPTQAQKILEEEINNFSQAHFTFNWNGKRWQATAKEFGLSIRLAETISQAYQVGHNHNLFKNWWQQFKTSLLGYQLTANWQINEEKLKDYLTSQLSSLEEPVQETSLFFEDNQFKLILAKEGKEINRALLKTEIGERAANLEPGEIKIELIKVFPEVEVNEVSDQVKENALAIIANPITLKYKDRSWLVKSEEILSWIDFKPVEEKRVEPITNYLYRAFNFSNSRFPLFLSSKYSKSKVLGFDLDREAIKDYLTQITPEINREPVNAQLTIEDGRAVIFSLDQEGVQLKTKESIAKIIQSITNNQPEVILEVITEEPEVTIKNINNLGITSLIGRGTSNFGGSPRNRRHNISVGAARFHGVLIKPGEEFSFNQTLGEVGPQQGYLAELVIKKNATVPEYGGGLCQVSTTAFRAALYAGLPITERYPHAYPVVYYNPQGMDATIYPPHPDLRFINDTSGHILIQTKVEGNILTFDFYGPEPDREVKIIGPYQYDVKSDGSMKAVLYREIYQDNQLVSKDTFSSTYDSPAKYPHPANPLE